MPPHSSTNRSPYSLPTALSASIGDDRPPRVQFADIRQRLAYLEWLGEMSERMKKRTPDFQTRREMLETIYYEAKRAGLDPGLMLGLIQVESGFRKYAISSAGARGLTQVMPFWTGLIGDGDPKKLFNMQANIRYGCVVFRHYLDTEHGDYFRALGRYQRQPRATRVSEPRARRVEALGVRAGTVAVDPGGRVAEAVTRQAQARADHRDAVRAVSPRDREVAGARGRRARRPGSRSSRDAASKRAPSRAGRHRGGSRSAATGPSTAASSPSADARATSAASWHDARRQSTAGRAAHRARSFDRRCTPSARDQ